jgi:hypothetical protein
MTRDRARHLCIEKLARLIYECVDCTLEGQERADMDWKTAAAYLDAHKDVVNVVACSCWPDTFDSNAFEQTYGEHIYQSAFRLMIRENALPKPPYGTLRCGG